MQGTGKPLICNTQLYIIRITFSGLGSATAWPFGPINHVVNVALCYIYLYLLSGIWNIDDQHRNPNIDNRDHLVGQLTTP